MDKRRKSWNNSVIQDFKNSLPVRSMRIWQADKKLHTQVRANIRA